MAVAVGVEWGGASASAACSVQAHMLAPRGAQQEAIAGAPRPLRGPWLRAPAALEGLRARGREWHRDSTNALEGSVRNSSFQIPRCCPMRFQWL